jgi:hypothetical protein
MPKRRRTTHRLVDAVLGPSVQYGFIASIAAAVFVIFNSAFDSLAGDGTWQAALKLGMGLSLAGIGALLAFDLHGARWLLLSRLLGRAQAKGREPAGFLGAVSWRMRNPLFALIGFAWLGLGLLEVARGAGGLF